MITFTISVTEKPDGEFATKLQVDRRTATPDEIDTLAALVGTWNKKAMRGLLLMTQENANGLKDAIEGNQ